MLFGFNGLARHVVLGGAVGELVALPGVVADDLAGLHRRRHLGPQHELADVVEDPDLVVVRMPRAFASAWPMKQSGLPRCRRSSCGLARKMACWLQRLWPPVRRNG